MRNRKRSTVGWIALNSLSILVALILITRIPYIAKQISQFNALGIGDRASLIIACMATFAFMISIWQSVYSVRVNNKNNELAKDSVRHLQRKLNVHMI